MRVLFVDDEPAVLEAIQRTLDARDPPWDVGFATSATQALMQMAAQPVDAIVADMRMPEMDGAALLQRVQARWPATMRVLLSSHTDQDAAIRALNVAHQFVGKPCNGAVLVAAIERYNTLQTLLQSDELRRLIGGIDKLPAAPRVFAELWRTLSNPQQDASCASMVIGRDPALTAKVLHLANSAFLRRGAAIEDIHTAVTRIGVAMLRTLVLATEVFALHGDDARIAELQAKALHASVLARRLSVARADTEVAVTAALLADVGLLVPAIDDVTHKVPAVGGIPVTHAEVGAYLLGLWGLPMPIVEAVAHHHAPSRVVQSEFGPIAVVHIAVALANGAGVDEALLRRLGRADALPGWRIAASQQWNEEAA